jgi:hypothetical protein
MAGYVYVAQMDIPPEHDAEFNRIYDTDHIPIILKVGRARLPALQARTGQSGRRPALHGGL